MSEFISRPDLWEKLIERKQENMKLDVGFHINMGINQAIGIMNSLPTYEIPPCQNCGEQTELGFMLKFAREENFFFTGTRKQLRSLWTAYCIRRDYECDTQQYDYDLFCIWQAIRDNESCPWLDEEDEGEISYGYGEFENFMCEEVI